MPRTLSDDDVEAIAQRVVLMIGGRLAAPLQSNSAANGDRPQPVPLAVPAVVPKLAYTAEELCTELSLSRDTIYKLEVSGRLRAIPGVRHKRYSRTEVERLLRGDRTSWDRK